MILKQLHQVDKLKNTPVIAVSVDDSIAKVQAAKEAGFADFLRKPVDTVNFLSMIDALLHGGQSEVINKVSSI